MSDMQCTVFLGATLSGSWRIVEAHIRKHTQQSPGGLPVAEMPTNQCVCVLLACGLYWNPKPLDYSQVRELSDSLSTAQQQLAAAQSAQAADAASAEQRLRLLQQQLAAAEAGLMRRMTGEQGLRQAVINNARVSSGIMVHEAASAPRCRPAWPGAEHSRDDQESCVAFCDLMTVIWL
jgi:hypothetical protein